MPISDLPTGEWTPILIGDLWPSPACLAALSAAHLSRQNVSSNFHNYTDLIHGIKSRNLGPQQGITADDIRGALERGATQSGDVTHTNEVKSGAYSAVHAKVVDLRSKLRELAAEGNARIEAVNKSKTLLSEKVAQITGIVTEIRALAFLAAAACIGEISDQIRAVLTVQGIETSPQAFAAANGVGALSNRATDPQSLKDQISNQLNGLRDHASSNSTTGKSPSSTPEQVGNSATPEQSSNTTGLARSPENSAGSATPEQGSSRPLSATPEQVSSTPSQSTVPQSPIGSATPEQTQPVAPGLGTTPLNPVGSATPEQTLTSGTPGMTAPGVVNGGSIGSSTAAPVQNLGVPTASSTTAPDFSGSSLATTTPPSIDAPAASTASSAGNPISAPHAPAAPAPTDLAQSFNAGNQTGAPMSASAEAISSAATSPVHSAAPPFGSPMADAGSAATPSFETAHAAAAAAPPAEAAQIAQAPTAFTQPVVAAPTAAPIAPSVAAPPPISAGSLSMPTATPPSSLLAYGSDLRPATTSVPTPPSMPPATAPGSAPVSPASGSSSTGQPAVVRQQPPTAAAQTGAAAGLAERAFAAAATGAAAGAGAAHAAAKDRLQRLLEAVARQQPKLNWAIGGLEDGTTVLATDLAGGWIPPGVEIPTGVKLLGPGTRSGNLESMLGATTLATTYRPGQYLLSAKNTEPVAMSIRARDTTAVDDLGWELSQATKWRDGLPRLAHTLAKAVSSKSGHLASEVELLRDYLTSITRLVISKYPDHVNPVQVGNWQLLATIDALINNEKTLANYHFAWFQAQVLTREEKP